MGVAAIIGLITGVVAGLPQDIAAFNALKAMLDKDPNATITPDELEKLRQDALTEHQKTQES